MPDKKRRIEPRTAIGLVVTIVWLVGWVIWTIPDDWSSLQPNQWGDWAAGTFAPIAFLWLVIGYFQQGDELQQNTKALKAQEEALKKQAEQLQASVKTQQSLAEAARVSADAASTNARLAEDANKLARDQYVATHRPWLTVRVVPNGPVKFDENGVSVSVAAVVKNIGKTPARNIWIEPLVVLDPAKGGNATELIREMAAIRKAHPMPWGVTLFPEQELHEHHMISVGKEEIEKATTSIKGIYPLVVAVTHYRFMFEEEPHYTGVAIKIEQNKAPPSGLSGKPRSPQAIWLNQIEVPLDHLTLTYPMMNGVCAD